MSNADRPLVLYFSAGAMSGVFSAGFSKAFEEAGLKEYVHSVYGNSAGALTGLCFLSGQIQTCAELYWEDLEGEKYIRWSRLPTYVLRAFSNAVLKTSLALDPVFDIDYIENILTTRRRIHFGAIQSAGTHLFMIVYNLSSRTHEFLEVKEEKDVIPTLRATAGGHPAYPHAQKIHGNLYVDGGTIDDEHRIAHIVQRHPDKEIICVLNNPRWAGSELKNFLNRCAIALIMLPFFGFREAFKTVNSDFGTTDIYELRKQHPFLHFVGNDLIGFQMSTNSEHHKMLFKRGYELGKEFILTRQLRTIPQEVSEEASAVFGVV